MLLLAETADGSIAELQRGMVLFVITALTLLIIFVAILLLVLSRRRFRQARANANQETKPLPDAWEEAARRAEPFEEGDE